MKLSYRGADYELQSLPLDMSESELVGKYRGIEVRMTSSARTVPQAVCKLSYRGAAYLGIR